MTTDFQTSIKEDAINAARHSTECEPDNHFLGAWHTEEHKDFKRYYCEEFARLLKAELYE